MAQVVWVLLRTDPATVLDGWSYLAFEWPLFGPEGALNAATHVSFSKDFVSSRLFSPVRGSHTLYQRHGTALLCECHVGSRLRTTRPCA
jgi:hypothetical protein